MISRKELYILAAVLLAAIIGHAYLTSVRNVAGAEAVKQMVEQETAKLRTDLAAELAKIAQDKKQVVTPQQIVVKIPEYVPGLPTPPVVSNPQQLPTSADVSTQLPSAPSQGLYFPPADVKPLFDRLASCKECDLKLAESQQENGLLTKRAEAAEKAMRGGSFFSRLKSNAKWWALGAGMGAAAGYAAHR